MALAACGVPDDGPTTSQFATKVERICTASRARINALSAMSASDAASIARGLERTVEEQRIAVSSIRAIPTPKGQRPKVDAWLESVDKMLKELESIGSALDGGDASNVSASCAKARTLADQANADATSLKLARCASTVAPFSTTTTTSTTSAAAKSDSSTGQ
jgi:hypothetical protein